MIHDSLLGPVRSAFSFRAKSEHRKRKTILLFPLAGFVLSIYWLIARRDLSPFVNPRQSSLIQPATSFGFTSSLPGGDRRISNGTLGFGAIFALGLPARDDKHDAMELATHLTNLKIIWSDGVPGSAIDPKSIPPVHTNPELNRNPEELRLTLDGEVGCWRGHMNIYRKIVREGISSALILEDDADWDVHIVKQMQQFALATNKMLADRSLTPLGKRPLIGSPYGEGWDILWVGHCGGSKHSRPQGNNATIPNDPTVPPVYDIEDITRLGNEDPQKMPCARHVGNDPKGAVCDSPRLALDERIVQESGGGPMCTPGYAVSLAGATKLLARTGGVSLLDVGDTIDIQMMQLCRQAEIDDQNGREGVRCLTPSPPYFKMHRAKGLVTADSDINDRQKGKVRELGYTKGLVWSTRLNIENLIAGLMPESQYLKDDKGHIRLRKANEYRGYRKDGYF